MNIVSQTHDFCFVVLVFLNMIWYSPLVLSTWKNEELEVERSVVSYGAALSAAESR